MLFAKAPRGGQVKTRLVPPLTSAEAAELHTAFVEDMLARLRAHTAFDVELHTDVNTDAWRASSVTRKLQIAGSLGLRMFHALETALASGYQRAAIVGSDAPTLPPSYLESLLRSRADVALGRAEDGGFWGISAGRVSAKMFAGVHWSQPDTLDQTVHAIEAAGLSIEVGPTWFDIDGPADLDRILAAPDLPPATKLWVDRHRGAIAGRTATL